MTHRPREDHPGAWWHLTNRGIAKRPVFETQRDVERFLAAIGEVVREGLLEVHAFSVLTTHYHLLVRSPRGDVSLAVKLAANEFVRWFNRTRRRDGSLFRGRFCGRRIDDADYWANVLRYIDLNPVRAGMCRAPSEHPWGSARTYRYGDGPDWLATSEVLASLAAHCAPLASDPARYDELAMLQDDSTNAFLVERMLVRSHVHPAATRDLLRAATGRQRDWLEWKARLADGMSAGAVFLSPHAAAAAAQSALRAMDAASLPEVRAPVDRDLAAGLLESASGLDVTEVARHLGVSRATAYAAVRRHGRWMGACPAYSDAVRHALAHAVRRTLTAPASVLGLPPIDGARTGSARTDSGPPEDRGA